MGIYNQNISFWHEDLKKLAINLVIDENLWAYDEQNGIFNHGKDMEELNIPQKFKIISNVGLEILTKSVCIKRNIDIFKEQSYSVKQYSPFGVAGVIAPQNPWLESIIQKYKYTHMGEINTVEFFHCLNKLKKNLEQTEGNKKYNNLIDEVDRWRKFHRNTEVHLSLPLMFTSEYETRLRKLYNALLEIYKL
ncbi:hypothetical protein ACIQ4I_10440 [Rummeliibacillus sp. NPDC094406]|uniref:hypothetical protein n=1 Tax=Rummeliibacillus sp. NPDC094406 TaxID=3364511 RepID=UPI0037F6EF7E